MMDLKFFWNKYVRRAVMVEGILYSSPYGGPGEIAVARMGEEFLEPFLLKKATGCFVDAGANIGGWSFKASPFYPRVYAFEPNRQIFKKLKRTMQLNHIKNVMPLQSALGEKAGFSPQRIEHRWQPLKDGIGDMLVKASVWTIALDELHLDKISAIKIDVEGAGLAVVRGGLRSIEASMPTIAVECHTREELEIPSLLPQYHWITIPRMMPDQYPAYDAIIDGKQPFLVGTPSNKA